MKNKIQDIIHGKFDDEMPQLLLPGEDLEFSVIEEGTYEGSFLIESSGGEVRGIVTSPNPNITCLTEEFEGKRAQIRFAYHTEQFVEGEVDCGHFVITSNAGEYLLNFRAKITKEYYPSSIGRIKTLNDFSNLSKLNWEEAKDVFQSPQFLHIFRAEDEFSRLLYKAITETGSGSREMEEFLVGCGKKQRSRFMIEKTEYSFSVGKEPVMCSFVLRKSEWGYFEAAVSCDADFIKLPNDRIRMQDFTGKHTEVSYEIIPSLMHRGRNYARITVENAFGKQQVTVTVSVRGQRRKKSTASEKRPILCSLVSKFTDYQSGVTDKEVWSDASLKLLNQIRVIEPSNGWYPLFTAYVLWASGRGESAKGQMETFRKKHKGQRTPMYAFYRYLTSLDETNEEEIRRIFLEIREIYAKYPEHPVLFWVMLQMDDALNRNPERKYQTIKTFVTRYSASPVFYLETAKLFWKTPELLHRQELFENRVVLWMAKKDLLNETLALRILDEAQMKKQFEPGFYHLLLKCRELVPEKMAVKSICTYLIKMNRYGETYFPWFRRGIELHLKIAGLYEAYMMSWNRADEELPDEIVKYFTRTSSLPAKRKALLFSYVLQNRSRLGGDWDAYQEAVHDFAAEELKKGHMSEDLAVIYEAVKKQVSAEEWDGMKGEAESCYRLTTSGENIHALRVLQKESGAVQRVPVYRDTGYIYLYRRPFVILYEDSSGKVYSSKDSFRLRKMMSGEHIYAAAPKQKIPAERRGPDLRDRKAELERFGGSLSEMDALIRQAEADGINVLKYQEQLMIRMLFTGHPLKDHAQLFEKIAGDPDAVRIRDAYASWISYRYLTEDAVFSPAAASYIRDRRAEGKTINAYCTAALLKNYAQKRNEEFAEEAERILEDYLLDGIYFSFYKNLPLPLLRKYMLFGMDIVEYRGKPGEVVTFAAEGKREEMKEGVPGIYGVRVELLSGEQKDYSIVDQEGRPISYGTVVMPECGEEWSQTRYGKMCELAQYPEKHELQQEYARLCDLTETLFIPIKE